MPDGRLAGRLLVATPSLQDPNFRRTVVLLLDHGPGGALGLVLNRPTPAESGGILELWRDHLAPPGVVFAGGPVQTDAAICLAHTPIPSLGRPPRESASAADSEADPDGEPRSPWWQPLFDGLGTLDVARSPLDVDVPIDAVRMFAGYAGWSEGQLDAEIDAGAWWVVRSHPDDALGRDPAGLWRGVLRRQKGPMAANANFPADPSLN
jgi:putative transcriptional regulator